MDIGLYVVLMKNTIIVTRNIKPPLGHFSYPNRHLCNSPPFSRYLVHDYIATKIADNTPTNMTVPDIP